jgi:hypothetical protein
VTALGPARMALEQEAVLLHPPINPLVVRGLAALGQGSAAQDRMHPAIAVGGQVGLGWTLSRGGGNEKDDEVRGLFAGVSGCSALRPIFRGAISTPWREPQCRTFGHWQPELDQPSCSPL